MFEDDNLDDLDVGLEDLPSSVWGGHLLPSPSKAPHLPLHPPRQVQGLPVWKFQKQGARGKRKTLESVAVDYHFRYLVLYLDLEWFESIIDNCHFLEFSILAAFPRSSCQPLEI